MDLNRRIMLSSTAGLAALPVVAAAAATPKRAESGAAWLQPVLERYVAFGNKASGGAGDIACGAWLEETLAQYGYACERHAFDVPYFDVRSATLTCGEARATVYPQAQVIATGAQGVSAPIRLAEADADLAQSIVLVRLPYKRWITFSDTEVSQPVAEAFRKGAIAVVVVTNGPTKEAIALNASPKRRAFEKPVAILAPKDGAPFVAAAAEGRAATLVIDGVGGQRSAFNLIARLDRNASETMVISTPRSGWFGCAAERGSGLAVWLYQARWMAAVKLGVNVELLCTSGHEYDFLGGELYLADKAPPPSQTRLWLHIGASAAARDWHEMPFGLRPLPTADTQRVLTASAHMLDGARSAFAGIAGLEATYESDRVSAGGELVNVIKAGYPSAAGLYGIHRFFHTPADDLRCTSGELVLPVAAAFRTVIPRFVKSAARHVGR